MLKDQLDRKVHKVIPVFPVLLVRKVQLDHPVHRVLRDNREYREC